MRPLTLLLLVLASACNADDSDAADGLVFVAADPTESPLAGLSKDWTDRFNEGDSRFSAAFRESQGLGPAYIRAACSSCHAEDARGPGAQTRAVVVEDDGVTPATDQSELPFGALMRPLCAGGASVGVELPESRDNLLISTRIGPAVFGRGYVDAVSDAEIERVEAEQAEDGRVSGRAARLDWDGATPADTRFYDVTPGDTALIGRFGMKAAAPTLDRFVAGALLGDISITSPLLPDELANPDGLDDDLLPGVDVDADTVDALADYVRLLDIPRRDLPDNDGAAIFEDIGCATCHVPTLHTRADYPIAQLADIDAPIYTDLLLHDRGVDMADGVEQGDASGREWRTAPLIGLRFLGSYMHDGRASTLREAIDTHAGVGSESAFSVDAFYALTDDEQRDLLDWLEAL